MVWVMQRLADGLRVLAHPQACSITLERARHRERGSRCGKTFTAASHMSLLLKTRRGVPF